MSGFDKKVAEGWLKDVSNKEIVEQRLKPNIEAIKEAINRIISTRKQSLIDAKKDGEQIQNPRHEEVYLIQKIEDKINSNDPAQWGVFEELQRHSYRALYGHGDSKLDIDAFLSAIKDHKDNIKKDNINGFANALYFIGTKEIDISDLDINKKKLEEELDVELKEFEFMESDIQTEKTIKTKKDSKRNPLLEAKFYKDIPDLDINSKNLPEPDLSVDGFSSNKSSQKYDSEFINESQIDSNIKQKIQEKKVDFHFIEGLGENSKYEKNILIDGNDNTFSLLFDQGNNREYEIHFYTDSKNLAFNTNAQNSKISINYPFIFEDSNNKKLYLIGSKDIVYALNANIEQLKLDNNISINDQVMPRNTDGIKEFIEKISSVNNKVANKTNNTDLVDNSSRRLENSEYINESKSNNSEKSSKKEQETSQIEENKEKDSTEEGVTINTINKSKILHHNQIENRDKDSFKTTIKNAINNLITKPNTNKPNAVSPDLTKTLENILNTDNYNSLESLQKMSDDVINLKTSLKNLQQKLPSKDKSDYEITISNTPEEIIAALENTDSGKGKVDINIHYTGLLGLGDTGKLLRKIERNNKNEGFTCKTTKACWGDNFKKDFTIEASVEKIDDIVTELGKMTGRSR